MLDKLAPNSDVTLLEANIPATLQQYNLKSIPWIVESSTTAKNCRNFIREIVDTLNLQPNPEKNVIALSIGDPTVYKNLGPARETQEAVINAIKENVFNGYAPSTGYDQAKQAVAEYLTYDKVETDPKDVILCSGCSSSIELCITALCDARKGQNIVIPRPGFAIYRTLAECIGVEVRYYNLIPENNFEADLQHLEDQIDARTAAIVLNNPSNPCGSVYSKEHLQDFLEIALKHKIPIIADEIYERLVFPGVKFTSTASIHSGVPILICGGLAKRFLVPGWRLGWIVVHDPIGAFKNVRKALVSLSQRTIGSNTLIQGALSDIFNNTPQNFHDDLIETLFEHSNIAHDFLGNCKGLTPFLPDGAMYMLVEIHLHRFPSFENTLDFVKKLMEEESVFCLPGECFGIEGFMRIVLTVPKDMLVEACCRINEFCNRYYVNKY